MDEGSAARKMAPWILAGQRSSMDKHETQIRPWIHLVGPGNAQSHCEGDKESATKEHIEALVDVNLPGSKHMRQLEKQRNSSGAGSKPALVCCAEDPLLRGLSGQVRDMSWQSNQTLLSAHGCSGG